MSLRHSPIPTLLPLLALALAGCDDQSPSTAEPAADPAAAVAAQSTAPAMFQLAASGYTSCAVALDSSAWCWGTRYQPDGLTSTVTPVKISGGLAFRQISADDGHVCGVTTDFRAYCWGQNNNGALGDGTATLRETPTAVAGGLRFYQVDAGWDTTCGVSYPDRALYCWGSNGYGQLGDGTQDQRLTPTRVLGNLTVRHVSAGANYTCAVTTDDKAYCWGYDQFGELGDDDRPVQHTTPVPVAGGLAFRQLEAGTSHTCAVTTTGVAYCWGYGGRGQLGNGKLLNRFTPRAVKTTVRFRRVAPGSGFTCGETPTIKVYCWGDNEFGQVGDGTTIQRLTPVPLTGGLTFAQVGAGGWNACGRTSNGTGYCWGLNEQGQLGDGTTHNRSRPTRIAAPVSPSLRAGPATEVPIILPARGDTLAAMR